MGKYEIEAHGNPVVAGELPLPLSTAAAVASGEESVDTSGFGMYSSGTGTGAITGGGMLPDQYATTATAIQTQLPCSLADYCSSEDDGMGGRRKKRGLKESIKEKVVPASGEGMTTGSDGDGQQGETHHEKKGLMERIKEKLPGHHH